MISLGKEHMTLALFGLITILRAIAYDYCKLTMITMIQKGADGNFQEILDTYSKISDNDSILLKVYFYYLQLQRLMFCGCFTSLGEFVESGKEDYKDDLMSSSKRKEYQQKARPLMIAWSWNGADLPLFLLVLMSLFGVIERYLASISMFFGSTVRSHYNLSSNTNSKTSYYRQGKINMIELSNLLCLLKSQGFAI